MATVTKPIALDESINTTEQTPRNIADVLAEELARIAENILPPNAEDIAYDNTASGLTATNVQDAIDEVISSQSEVIADTMADLTENKTATVTDGVADFETIDGSLVKSLVVEIEPSQSGSGTPSPSNIRPITGWTQEDVTVVGKNLFGFEETAIDATATYRPSASQRLTLSKINDNAVHCVYANGRYSRGYFELDGIDGTATYSISYTVENNTTSYTPEIRVDADNSDATKLVLIVSGGNNTESVSSSESFDLYNIQLELGSSATAYEPYHGKTYTTPFNQTVYGGTLDVLTGELTIDREFYTTTWGQGTSATVLGNNTRKVLPSLTSIPLNSDADSNIAPYLRNYSSDTPHFYVETSKQIFFILPNNTSDDTVIQICTYLATPTTLSLTPQTVKALVGENHIQASTGEVTECKYSMLINGDDLAQIMGG